MAPAEGVSAAAATPVLLSGGPETQREERWAEHIWTWANLEANAAAPWPERAPQLSHGPPADTWHENMTAGGTHGGVEFVCYAVLLWQKLADVGFWIRHKE